MPVTLNLADLAVGGDAPVAVSDWIEVTQDLITRFADVTGDAQWIHVDPARARTSRFGGTIAHGFLTLALIPRMRQEALTVAGTSSIVNYGLNRVRFITPVPAGSRIRAQFTVAEVTACPGGRQVTWKVTVENEGAARPCCVAEWLVRFYEGDPAAS